MLKRSRGFATSASDCSAGRVSLLAERANDPLPRAWRPALYRSMRASLWKWQLRAPLLRHWNRLSRLSPCMKMYEVHNIYIMFITKASFAELELPRLLNEVKYSNTGGAAVSCPEIQPQPENKGDHCRHVLLQKFAEFLGKFAPKICRIFGEILAKFAPKICRIFGEIFGEI